MIGDPASPETLGLLRAVYARYLPNKVVVGAGDAQAESAMPLLARKTRIGGHSAAYVCQHYRCRLPVTEPEDLAKQLDAK